MVVSSFFNGDGSKQFQLAVLNVVVAAKILARKRDESNGKCQLKTKRRLTEDTSIESHQI